MWNIQTGVRSVHMISLECRNNFGLKTFRREGKQDTWILLKSMSCHVIHVIAFGTCDRDVKHLDMRSSNIQTNQIFFCFPALPTLQQGGGKWKPIHSNYASKPMESSGRLEQTLYRSHARYQNLNHRQFPPIEKRKAACGYLVECSSNWSHLSSVNSEVFRFE